MDRWSWVRVREPNPILGLNLDLGQILHDLLQYVRLILGAIERPKENLSKSSKFTCDKEKSLQKTKLKLWQNYAWKRFRNKRSHYHEKSTSMSAVYHQICSLILICLALKFLKHFNWQNVQF